MIVYHHNDMDGKTAGWLVHTMKPTAIEDHPSDYIMMDYNSKFDKHTAKDDVFVVDFSISHSTYDQLIELCKTARTVTWIDHHASSLDVIEKHKDELQAISNLTYFVSKCACGAALVYSFFKCPQNELQQIRRIEEDEEYLIEAAYGAKGAIKVMVSKTNKKNKADGVYHEYDIAIPLWLYFVDDYDCWKKMDKRSDQFILGAELTDTSICIDEDTESPKFNNAVWDILTDVEYVEEIVNKGKTVQAYIGMRYDRELEDTFTYVIDGTKFICKNATGNSWNFADELARYGQAILFNYSGKSGKWEYSVYVDEHCSFNAKVFAEKFGGGGHPKASGFSTKELIFTAKNFKPKSNQIFLGGTVNSDWREQFIELWKQSDDKKKKEYELFNPIVPNWTPECIAKEDEVKADAKLNLFVVVVGDHVGPYSFVEATEASHYGKTFLAIYDEFGKLDDKTKKSYEAIGDIIKKNGGKFEIYHGEKKMLDIVTDVFKSL